MGRKSKRDTKSPRTSYVHTCSLNVWLLEYAHKNMCFARYMCIETLMYTRTYCTVQTINTFLTILAQL